MNDRESVALRVKREAIPYSNRERKQWLKAMRATPAPKAPVIPTGYLKRQVEAERLARVTPKAGGVIPVMPSTQVDTAEGRVAWKAWKAREARVTVKGPPTRAASKRASDGRSDKDLFYQHYKCWGVKVIPMKPDLRRVYQKAVLATMADLWPDPPYLVAAREARSALKKGLHEPKARPITKDVSRWRDRVASMHRLAAGGRGREINRDALAELLGRVG